MNNEQKTYSENKKKSLDELISNKSYKPFTISLDIDLHRDFKTYCSKHRLKMSEVIEEFIKKTLKKELINKTQEEDTNQWERNLKA